MKSLFFLTLCAVFSTLLSAQENVEQKREDSVREAIDEMARLKTKELSNADSIKMMFENSKVSGQIRLEYSAYDFKNSDPDTYATTMGGILKYELGQYKGFNAGVAFYSSKDISFLSAEGEHRNVELSSSEGEIAELKEAYLNYQYEGFNVRAGRQILDTPLADSDDIRMIQNSFEAYVLTYTYENWNFLAGNIQSWHGTDLENGLDDGWVDIGDKGANFAGLSYYDMWEFQSWFYNVSEVLNAYYVDFGIEYPFNDQMSIHTMVQYLYEDELKQSGYGAEIYGALAEVVYQGFGFNLAYNYAKKQKQKESFSGYGGGTLFTNMDMMIMDNISYDRDVKSVVGGIVYNHDDKISLLYAYGDFLGGVDSLGDKAHVTEQNFVIEYNLNKDLLVAFIYLLSEDKQNELKTEYDYKRTQVTINYNF